MNLVFLTMTPFYDLEDHNIYADLLKEFVAHGHKPYLVSPCEKRKGMPTELIEKGDYAVLRVRVGNTSNVSFVEKGISTVLLEQQYKRAIKKYLSGIDFGLILYSTPPVTLAGVVKHLKRKYKAHTYLMLKDIFPQNAVDLGMMRKGGMAYKYFRYLEKELYRVSDNIGCMSQANVDYVLENNSTISEHKVEICPNAITPHIDSDRSKQAAYMREAYSVPENAVIFLYGGNLGKPQGIPFLVDCLKDNIGKPDRFFLICGSGSEYGVIKDFIDTFKPDNIRLIDFLPKAEYDALVQGCDVGLIFLDFRFTIPNYPSRILSYMEQSIPVLSCTDKASDMAKTIKDGGFGWSCYSDSVDGFTLKVDEIVQSRTRLADVGKRAYEYLLEYYQSSMAYKVILDSIKVNCEDIND